MTTEETARKVGRREFLRNSTMAAAGAAGATMLVDSGAALAQPAVAKRTAASKTTLRFWHMDYPPHNKTFGEFAKAFEAANPDIAITLQGQPSANMTAKYQQAFVSHTQPDLISIHGGAAALFVQSGVLAPLNGTAFPAGVMERTFFPNMLQAYSDKGQILGLPLANNTPGIGMVINLDHFREAKLEIPDQFSSWDQVWEYAQKLTRKDAAGRITRAGLNVREGHQMQYVMGMMLEQGRQYFDPKTGSFSFQNPEAYRAIHVLTDAVSKYKVDSPSISDAMTSLANGLSSMGLIWIDYLPYAKSQFPGKNFGFIVRPPLAGNKLIVVSEGPWGVQVTAASQNKEAAMKFIQFMGQTANLRKWYQEQNALPSAPALLHDSYFSTADGRWLRKALQTMPTWTNEGSFPIWHENSDISWPLLQSAILGKLSVEKAAQQIEQESNAMYKQFQAQVQGLH